MAESSGEPIDIGDGMLDDKTHISDLITDTTEYDEPAEVISIDPSVLNPVEAVTGIHFDSEARDILSPSKRSVRRHSSVEERFVELLYYVHDSAVAANEDRLLPPTLAPYFLEDLGEWFYANRQQIGNVALRRAIADDDERDLFEETVFYEGYGLLAAAVLLRRQFNMFSEAHHIERAVRMMHIDAEQRMQAAVEAEEKKAAAEAAKAVETAEIVDDSTTPKSA